MNLSVIYNIQDWRGTFSVKIVQPVLNLDLMAVGEEGGVLLPLSIPQAV